MKTTITNLVVHSTALHVSSQSRQSGRMTTVVTSAVHGPKGYTGAAGAAGAGLHLETFTLTERQIEGCAIELPFPPDRPEKTVVHVQGGIRQFYVVDFVVNDSTLSWDGLAMELLLSAGSLIQVEILV